MILFLGAVAIIFCAQGIYYYSKSIRLEKTISDIHDETVRINLNCNEHGDKHLKVERYTRGISDAHIIEISYCLQCGWGSREVSQ